MRDYAAAKHIIMVHIDGMRKTVDCTLAENNNRMHGFLSKQAIKPNHRLCSEVALVCINNLKQRACRH